MFVFSLPISSLNRVTELLRNFIITFWWIGHQQKGLTDGKYKGAKKLAPCLFFGSSLNLSPHFGFTLSQEIGSLSMFWGK